MNKYIFLFIIAVILGTITILGYGLGNFSTGVKPLQTNFSFTKAPTQSFIGTITALSGTVLWQSRTADQPENISNPHVLQQGESLATKNGIATVTFPENIVSFSLDANSQVNIIQTLPDHIVLAQQSGSVVYIVQQRRNPVSVRVSTLLLNLNAGVYTIAFDNEASVVTITDNQGTLTAAYNDLQNTTQVIPIQKGMTLTYHTDTKTIQE